MEKKKNKTDINCFAAPRADHLVGQQGARGVAARSPREEVVAEVPSTPHRYLFCIPASIVQPSV